jgi:hypothetical protein
MVWVKNSILSNLWVMVFSSMIYNITRANLRWNDLQSIKMRSECSQSAILSCYFLEYNISAFVILAEF